MKRSFLLLSLILLTVSVSFSQKAVTGAASITASDLEGHMMFLGSPLLKGRLNGSPELDIAAGYLASQAKKIGLKPVAGNSYIYPYTTIKKSMDQANSYIRITSDGKEGPKISDPIYQVIPMGAADFELEGEVVFGGYGLKQDNYNYNDFGNLEIAGKILIVMSRAPVAADGIKGQFEDQRLMTSNGLWMKIQSVFQLQPKALLIVSDPKSGTSSMNELYPEIDRFLRSSLSLKGAKSQNYEMPGMPKVLLVHRKVADQLLDGTGHTLEELQNAIDSDLSNHSFLIKGKTIKIKEAALIEEVQMPNIAGIIEGSDPVLKDEVVIFSGHMDHVGGVGANIKPGADDNASGCAALLELAEAFQSLPRKPLRSVMFLWVSGEEVGLFGSQSYVNNPAIPLEKTVADLNMDMIGRVKGIADSTKSTPMTGPDEVFVITDDQSKELVSIANSIAAKNKLKLNYELSGKDHPEMLFARSDHFNFAKKDIPILFFTTGLHSDYHKTGDVIEKIDFRKMELISRTMYEIGFRVANQKTRVVVDNPFSKWQNNPFRMME